MGQAESKTSGVLVPVNIATPEELSSLTSKSHNHLKQLVIMDPQECIRKFKELINWDDSGASDAEKHEFLTEVLLPKHHIISLHEDEVGAVTGVTFDIDTDPGRVMQECPCRLDPVK